MNDDAPTPAPDEADEQARQLMIELGEQAEWDRVHAEAQKEKLFTGERLKQLNPAKHKIIVRLLSIGLGVVKIAKLVGVSHHTVQAIRDESPLSNAAEKVVISDRMRRMVRLLLERAEDEIDKVPLDRVPQFVETLTRNMQLLDGQATARVETGPPAGAMSHEAMRDYIASLPRATPAAIEGEKPAVLIEAPKGEPASRNGGLSREIE